MLCLHCKNKTSNERCGNKCLANLNFCGKHAKVKDKRIWTKVMNAERVIISIQAIFRGWLIRNTLSLAGPGVLNSKVRHNEEDLVTCDQVDPFDYFAFEEGKKVYWFDVRTIYQWASQTLEPLNPYTKQPLTIETRKRLKRVIARRELFGVQVYHDPDYFQKIDQIKFLWIQIIQVLNENLFAEIPESYFTHMNEFQIIDFASNVLEEIEEWKESKNKFLTFFYTWVEYCRDVMIIDFFQGYVPFLITILGITRYYNLQYDFSFKLMSARAITV